MTRINGNVLIGDSSRKLIDCYTHSTLSNCNEVPTDMLVNISSYSAAASNKPGAGGDGLIISFCPDPDYIYQFAMRGSSPVELYTRAKYVGIWGSWIKIA